MSDQIDSKTLRRILKNLCEYNHQEERDNSLKNKISQLHRKIYSSNGKISNCELMKQFVSICMRVCVSDFRLLNRQYNDRDSKEKLNRFLKKEFSFEIAEPVLEYAKYAIIQYIAKAFVRSKMLTLNNIKQIFIDNHAPYLDGYNCQTVVEKVVELLKCAGFLEVGNNHQLILKNINFELTKNVNISRK